MKHFMLVVAGGNVGSQMAPYDNSLETAEHRVTCRCVGSRAHRDALHAAEERYGKHIVDIISEWWANGSRKGSLSEALRPLHELASEIEREHPMFSAADPACPECDGTGALMTRANDHGRWDSYEIGGLWKNHFIDRLDWRADICPKGRIDWDAMATDYVFDYREERRKSDGIEKAPGDGAWRCSKCNTVVDLGSTECPDCHEFIFRTHYGRRAPYAILSNGEWKEKGGMDDAAWEDLFDAFIDELSDDVILTVVDCCIFDD